MATIKKKRVKEVHIPNDEDNGMVVLRNLSMEEEAIIEAKYLNISESGVSFSSYAERTAHFAKTCLEGWGNIKDEHKVDLKFTPANVDYASALVIISEDEDGEETRVRFFEWINDEREKFAKELIEEEKVAKGN